MDTTVQPEQEDLLGQYFGNFKTTRLIGRGGMGAVYEAVHVVIHHRAAVKVMSGREATDPAFARRFLDEARAVNIVEHPALVRVFEFGQREQDGALYIVMELLQGRTLSEHMAGRGPLPVDESVAIGRQLARALATAHGKGVVHRDLKPDNLILVAEPEESGTHRVKILDFGIAKLSQGTRSGGNLTAAGWVLGTPLYMAPEQYGHADTADGKADVFALGVILFEMLSGQLPWRGSNSLLVLTRAVPPLRKLRPDVPPPLATLIASMLAKEAAARPTMAQVAEVIEAGRISAPPQAALPRRRAPWLLVAVLAAVTATSGTLTWWQLHAATLRALPTEQPVSSERLQLARRQALRALREFARAASPDLRSRAARALGQSRDAVVRPDLEQLLRDSSPEVTAAAAEALGQIADPSARPALEAQLAVLHEGAPRLAVLAALAKLQAPLAQSRLRAALVEGSPALRPMTAQSLRELGDPSGDALLEQIAREGELPAAKAARLLRLLGERGGGARDTAVAQLRQRLAGGSTSSEERTLLLAALAQLGDSDAHTQLVQLAAHPGSQQLLAALSLAEVGSDSARALFRTVLGAGDATSATRALAVRGLGFCGRASDVLLLERTLGNTAMALELRGLAAESILRLVGPEVQRSAERDLHLAQALLASDDWAARLSGVEVIGALLSDEEQDIAALRASLRDTDPRVRLAGLSALSERRVQASMHAIGEALQDGNAEVRTAALKVLADWAETLPQRGEPGLSVGILTQLRARAESSDGVERAVARSVLLRSGDDSQLAALREHLRTGDRLARQLIIELASPRGALVRQGLLDADLAVRFVAARKLADAGLDAGAAVLSEVLTRGGSESLVAFGLLRRLGQGPSPPVQLAGLLTPSAPLDVRFAAVDVLGDLPLAEGLPLLEMARVDRASVVRRRALAAAVRLYQRERAPRLLEIVRGFLIDPEPVVRARAAAVLLKIEVPVGNRAPGLRAGASGVRLQQTGPQPTAQPSDAPAPPPAPPDLADGIVEITAAAGVRVRIDGGKEQVCPCPGMSLSPGVHLVRHVRGVERLEVQPGQTHRVRIPLLLAEQDLEDARSAVQARQSERAQVSLNRASSALCKVERSGPICRELSLLQIKLFELQGRSDRALDEYANLLDQDRKNGGMAALPSELAERYRVRLGVLRIHRWLDGRCVESVQHLRRGQVEIELGSRKRTVEVVPGEEQRIGECELGEGGRR